MDVNDQMHEQGRDSIPGLKVLFEDASVLLVDKPAGLLSQPGKVENDSVLTRVIRHREDLHGPVLVHRLDMDTSGILLLAKNRQAHRQLQQQFEHRLVRKRYRAVLDQPVDGLGGIVKLPLRLDIDNRPRQIVCPLHGKSSSTLWHRDVLGDGRILVLYPLTGRTHQLRVHMADPLGLGSAIVGDRLYGHNGNQAAANRLMLHAEFLSFEHPGTRKYLSVECKAPFV
jgi:tRNA pseudouridine32 synthase/23S rRNA pseudouridine746 synthase